MNWIGPKNQKDKSSHLYSVACIRFKNGNVSYVVNDNKNSLTSFARDKHATILFSNHLLPKKPKRC